MYHLFKLTLQPLEYLSKKMLYIDMGPNNEQFQNIGTNNLAVLSLFGIYTFLTIVTVRNAIIWETIALQSNTCSAVVFALIYSCHRDILICAKSKVECQSFQVVEDNARYRQNPFSHVFRILILRALGVYYRLHKTTVLRLK